MKRQHWGKEPFYLIKYWFVAEKSKDNTFPFNHSAMVSRRCDVSCSQLKEKRTYCRARIAPRRALHVVLIEIPEQDTKICNITAHIQKNDHRHKQWRGKRTISCTRQPSTVFTRERQVVHARHMGRKLSAQGKNGSFSVN